MSLASGRKIMQSRALPNWVRERKTLIRGLPEAAVQADDSDQADNDNDQPAVAEGVPSASSRHFPPFGALRAFDAVGRLGSIRKAGRALARDHAVVSRHVRALEEWTGVSLLRRKAHGIELTDAGRAYHRQISHAIDLIAQATREVTAPNDLDTLKIRCMPAFALHWLGPRIGAFEAEHPELNLDLRPTERVADTQDASWDLNIRMLPEFVAQPELEDLEQVLLARVPIIATASPQFIEQNKLKGLDDLCELPLLHEEDTEAWAGWLNAQGVRSGSLSRGPVLWQGHLTLDAARNGRGVALSNPLVAGPDLAQGTLLDVVQELGTQQRAFGHYSLIMRAETARVPIVVAFKNWLIEALAEAL